MLDAATEAKIQALVFTGFGTLPDSRLIRLHEIGPQWLEQVLPHIAFGRSRFQLAAQVLLTSRGLAALGASADEIARLGRVFEQGMTSPQSRQRLGDRGSASPENWAWSDRDHDAALLLYGLDAESLDAAATMLTAHALVDDMTPLSLPPHGREPFGFRDGISNVALARRDRTVAGVVPDGELLLGHPDATGATPRVGALGIDGSFVAVRELHQDIEAFWRFWQTAADGDVDRAILLASKALGRWPNGMPIEPDQEREPPLDESRLEIRSFAQDRDGIGCPVGSHVRRANPRDVLVETAKESRAIMALHRILRRGRVLGPPAPAEWYAEPLQDVMSGGDAGRPEAERGLMFIALCTDLRRQLEFIVQNWLNFAKFANLYNEVDPILSHDDMPRTFGLRTRSFSRYIEGTGDWVQTRGGGYYLLPSRAALERLSRRASA